MNTLKTRSSSLSSIFHKSILFVLASSPALSGQEFEVNTKNSCLRLRTGSSYSYRVKDCIQSKSRVEILSEANDNGFARVRTESGEIGYVYAKMLKPKSGQALKPKSKPAVIADTQPQEPAAAEKPKPADQPQSQVKPQDQGGSELAGQQCVTRTLTFSADFYHEPENLPRVSVWGGNAAGRDENAMNPPFVKAFLSRVEKAKKLGHETFAYLGGPCGDTDGNNDGESESCRRIHNKFNNLYAKGTGSSASERWKPYTMTQMKLSGKYGIDHCEVDNLQNESKDPQFKVNIPIIPFLKEVKALYDDHKIHCKIVLKNIDAATLTKIKEAFPKPSDAEFISPFAIFEIRPKQYTKKLKDSLDQKMNALKGTKAVTILSTNSKKYGSAFGRKGLPDKFQTCSSAASPSALAANSPPKPSVR